jgi:murein DD-endopeptidase MepM/ murein hydrolase activator NlpD
MPAPRIQIRPSIRWIVGIKRQIQLVFVVILVVSCKGLQPSSSSADLFPTSQHSTQATASPSEDALPPSLLTSIQLASPSATQSRASIATAQPEMVVFADPTPGILPVADWRPPLYPTPWAPTLYDHFFFASPIAANEINEPVSDYRYGGVFFEDVVHTGIDIPAPKGTPILAAGAGTVTWAGYGVFQGGYDPTDPYGLAVTIQHDFGYQNQALYTVYGHMSEIDVVQGQHVETGDLLGLVGETGIVTGPHLHFEVRLGKNDFFTTRNPELWLVPPIGYGIIAGRVTDTIGQLLYDQQIIITNSDTEQNWFAWSYGKTVVNSDRYYQENLVIGDLPAGSYILRADFGGVSFKVPIQVYPGMVNYFTLRGYWGLTLGLPAAPGADFTPEPFDQAIP